MQKNGLFRQYFSVCSLCVVTSIVVLGVVLMMSASRYVQRNQYDLLERNVRQAAAITARTYVSTGAGSGSFDKTVITLSYTVISGSIDAEFFLTDLSGRVVYHMQNEKEPVTITQVSQNAVWGALDGRYVDTGNMEGVFASPRYTVGVPVEVDGTSVGILFASTSASSMNDFISKLVELFLICSAIVLFMAFVLIYFVTMRLVRPLKEMLHAVNSFSKGDFSKRVPVSGYDELGQLSMAFNNMASSLATTESSRRSFVANVSHELKTPMTTIGGFVDGILDGTVPEEKREQYLHVVSNEVKRLSRLVRSMLDTSRIEAGELELRPSLFDISEQVRQTVISFEQVIEEKRLNIEGLDVDKVMIYADADLMNQVVYNLIENAVKFVNQEGTISFQFRSEGDKIWVAIRNTGEGLDREELPQLFERFYKSDKSRSLNKNGVGLGLSIVRTIINYHQGEILVRSVPEEYTEFEFAIPVPKNT